VDEAEEPVEVLPVAQRAAGKAKTGSERSRTRTVVPDRPPPVVQRNHAEVTLTLGPNQIRAE
jgi:hypothetical protein